MCIKEVSNVMSLMSAPLIQPNIRVQIVKEFTSTREILLDIWHTNVVKRKIWSAIFVNFPQNERYVWSHIWTHGIRKITRVKLNMTVRKDWKHMCAVAVVGNTCIKKLCYDMWDMSVELNRGFNVIFVILLIREKRICINILFLNIRLRDCNGGGPRL